MTVDEIKARIKAQDAHVEQIGPDLWRVRLEREHNGHRYSRTHTIDTSDPFKAVSDDIGAWWGDIIQPIKP